MNSNLTEILFILDRSGSMDPLTEVAIAGFNEFLREQTAEPGLARLTLVLFDDQYEVPVSSLPLPEIIPLDVSTYVPRGSTALLDAIGRGVDELGTKLAALPEPDRPGKVIVAILTDGEENASRHFDWQQISARIRHQTNVYGWNFLFLGANQDTIATAAKMGIAAQNSATYLADAAGYGATTASLGRKMKAIRKQGTAPLSAEEQADLAAPMDQIVQDEDRKRRGK